MNHSRSNRSCLSPLKISLDPKQWSIQLQKRLREANGEHSIWLCKGEIVKRKKETNFFNVHY